MPSVPSVTGIVWVGGQRCLLLLAVAVHRLHAFDHRLAPEAIAFIIGRRANGAEPADPKISGKVRRAAARQIADEQTEWQRPGANGGLFGAGDRRTHRRQAVFIDLERLAGIDRLVAIDHGQIVISHRRALGCGPYAFAGAVGVDDERQIELRIGAAMRQAQRALEGRGQAEAGPDGFADDMLHMDRLALADERAIEHGVEDLRAVVIAIGQIEIIGPNTLAPIGERETEIAALARRHHQRVRFVVIVFAPPIGLRRRQAVWDKHPARSVGPPTGEQRAGAAVGDADIGAGDRLRFETQARQSISNMLAILTAAGGAPDRLARVTAYIVGVENWPLFNTIYAQMLPDARPARTVVPVPELHYGFLVELDAIAILASK